jgi:hypothetical protein
MSMRTMTWAVLALLPLALCSTQFAGAQQSKVKSPPNRPATQPAAKSPAKAAPPAADPADAARKAAILNSSQWRRAMFEFNEWLSAQQIYDAQEVEQMKAGFNQRVAHSSADEVQFILEDLNAKFQILDSKPAQEARAWLGHYLSMLADWKREEVLKELPNFATMTAAQLSQEIMKIQQKRSLASREQAASDRNRQVQVNAQLQANRDAQQAYIRQQNQAPAAYTSPYRQQTADSGKPPFADRKTGPDMKFYSGNFGQFGIVFSPSSY